MKAIFLDIDGVIATPTSVRLSYLLGRSASTQLYDGVALSYLGRLVAQTGAEVVLSSNWRGGLEGSPEEQAIMENLLAQLADAGAPIAGTTPSLPGHDRSSEVGSWLSKHTCERWVILDDLARFEERPEVAEDHLVRIDDSEGIRWQHYQRAVKLLQASTPRSPR